jgi:hypothetical protein
MIQSRPLSRIALVLHRRFGIEILEILVADLHHRRIDAGAEAFDLAQGEGAVLGRLAEVDAEPLLAGLHDRVGAAQPAGRRRADLQQVLSDRLQIEHGVEARDLVDADRRHVEDLGHMVHGGAVEPAAILRLRQMEQRDHRARLAARRIFGDDFIRFCAILAG